MLKARSTASAGWLRNAQFDLGFIAAITGIALLSGFAISLNPNLLVPLMLADLWLLGYHHVVSTFTRLAMDRESFRAHRFIVLYLPFIVLVAQRYEKDAGIGTIIALMIPYTVIVLVMWLIFFAAWYLLGIPLGPGYGVHL